MLISLIDTISWEMFDSNRNIILISTIHISAGKVNHHLWIVSKCSYICNWIVKLLVNINDWCKRPIHTKSCTFFAGNTSHFVAIFAICCCSYCHRLSKGCSLKSQTISSCLSIGSKKKWHLGD